MPTYDEMNELYSNCTHIWTTKNGVNGRLFTGSNGNSIFLPAAGIRNGSELVNAGRDGYYWSSTRFDSDYAWDLDIYFDESLDLYSRYFGQSVRPVCNKQE